MTLAGPRCRRKLWKDDDGIRLAFNLAGRVIRGDYTNFSRDAVAWGPFVLAVDTARNAKLDDLEAVRVAKGAEPSLMSSSGNLTFGLSVWGPWDDKTRDVTLVPFADAGATGGEYRVWLRQVR